MSEAELQARSTKDMQKHASRRGFVRTFPLGLEMRPGARRRSSWPLQRRRACQRLQRLPRNRAGGVPPGQSKMLGFASSRRISLPAVGPHRGLSTRRLTHRSLRWPTVVRYDSREAVIMSPDGKVHTLWRRQSRAITLG
jgi:hypothetical protein